MRNFPTSTPFLQVIPVLPETSLPSFSPPPPLHTSKSKSYSLPIAVSCGMIVIILVLFFIFRKSSTQPNKIIIKKAIEVISPPSPPAPVLPFPPPLMALEDAVPPVACLVLSIADPPVVPPVLGINYLVCHFVGAKRV